MITGLQFPAAAGSDSSVTVQVETGISGKAVAVQSERLHAANHAQSSAVDAITADHQLEGANRITILFVDDSSTVRKCVSRFLARMPISLVFAEDGYEAIKQIQSGKSFDLIMADVMMPRISGYELCSMAKSRPRTASVPFYVVSSKEGPVDSAYAKACGADGFLTKPFDSSSLQNTIRRIVNIPEEKRVSL